MASEGDSLHPNVLWAQRKDKLFITICLGDVENKNLQLNKTDLDFSGTRNGVKYNVKIDFYDEVDPDKSRQMSTDREIVMAVFKTESTSQFWPRLMKEKGRVHWLKTDFNRWRDEDDSSDDEGDQEKGLQDLMSNMGKFDGPDVDLDADGEDLAPDSDDEDLPDLQ